MKPYDYLIVGSGLFGAVFAHEAHKAGKRCLVIEKRPHTGGNIYCEEVDGINVHKYGAHIFHTDNREVWNYVNRLVEFNRYTNSPIANYKGKLYNLPFNMNTFYQLWGVRTPAEARAKIQEQCREYEHITHPQNLEEQALKLCGKDIYRQLIKGYTEKQWGRPATELPAFIIRRIPFRFIFDNNYFNDPYQGIPMGGYNRLIGALLENIEGTHIKVSIQQMDWGPCKEEMEAGNYNLCLKIQGLPSANPFSLFKGFMHTEGGTNISYGLGYHNDHVDELIEEAAACLDAGRLTEIYTELQEISAVDFPNIPVLYSQEVVASSSDITGYQATVYGLTGFTQVCWAE